VDRTPLLIPFPASVPKSVAPPLTKLCSSRNSDDTRALHPSLSLPHFLLSDPEHRITLSLPEWCRIVATLPHFSEIDLPRALILLAPNGLPPHILARLPKLHELP
jgi:hypothetical protein